MTHSIRLATAFGAFLLLCPTTLRASGASDESWASAVAGSQGGSPRNERVDPERLLPIREARLLALRHNLDVKLARIEPEIAQQQLRESQGAFDPRASVRVGMEREKVANSRGARQLSGTEGLRGVDYSAGIEGALPAGLRYSSRYEIDRSAAELNAEPGGFEAVQRTQWTTELTLPLLRDAGTNPARVRVARSELETQMAEHTFQTQLVEVIERVENRYWELAATRAEVRRARRSLATARRLLEQTRLLEQGGIVPRVSVLEAEVGVAERELALGEAQSRADTAHDELLGDLLAPDARTYGDHKLVPEIPTFEPYGLQLDAAIAEALRTRPELREARTEIRRAAEEQRFAQNQTRARFDLVARYTLSGLDSRSDASDRDDSRARLCTTRSGRDARICGPDGLAGDARRGFSVGAQLQIPIGNRAARAAAAQRSSELRRAKTRVRKLEQAVIRDVREAARGILSAEQAVRSAEQRRAAAQALTIAEQERLKLGESTPFRVLEIEEKVGEAERQWIFALRDHRNAIVQFEAARGTLLESRGIELEGELPAL